jgi:hypothetical protein
MKADADLMLDIGRAGTELERRLSENVRAQDGIVIIHSPMTGRFMSQVLSPNTPWVLSCGVGISIVFGSSVSGDASSISNECGSTPSLQYGRRKRMCDARTEVG